MLEHYYIRPPTIDRIPGTWLGAEIEDYLGWMEANGYSSRTVFRRMPRLFCFAEYAQKEGPHRRCFCLCSRRGICIRIVGSARTGSEDIGIVAQAWN